MGGLAIKNSIPVLNQDVEHIFEIFSFFLSKYHKIPKSALSLIGSSGKSKSGLCGDIDIAIDRSAVKFLYPDIENPISGKDGLFDDLKIRWKNAEMPYRDMRHIGVMSFGFRYRTGLCQIDLMPVCNLEWAEWAFYSPDPLESPWKGLYRNEILYAVASHMRKEYEFAEDGTPVKWRRLFFDLNRGILTSRQTCLGKRNRVIKTVQTIGNKDVVTTHPDEACRFLLDVADSNKVLTWEQAFSIITDENYFMRDKLDSILKMAKQGIIKKKQPMPKELENI